MKVWSISCPRANGIMVWVAQSCMSASAQTMLKGGANARCCRLMALKYGANAQCCRLMVLKVAFMHKTAYMMALKSVRMHGVAMRLL